MTSSSVKRADQAAAARKGWSISSAIAIETAANINARQAMALQSLYSAAANTASLWAGWLWPLRRSAARWPTAGGRPIGSAIRGSNGVWLAASGRRRRSRTLAFAERRDRDAAQHDLPCKNSREVILLRAGANLAVVVSCDRAAWLPINQLVIARIRTRRIRRRRD